MNTLAKKKQEKEVTLESVLWDCRVALRGVGTTEKNRDAVISLVFLKFSGDKFDRRRDEIKKEYGDILMVCEKPAFYNAENAGANDIAVIIDKAMADIEDVNPLLKGALSLNLFSNLGVDKSKIKNLIDNINKIDKNIFHEEDLIGRVYEYFLIIYVASGTKEDEEFYTPSYYPCCGSYVIIVLVLKSLIKSRFLVLLQIFKTLKYNNLCVV